MFEPKNLCFLLMIVRVRNSKCEMEGRVVGGTYARIENFPHSAFLNAHCFESWICGSSVLNQRILLTAAHCVNKCDLYENRKHVIEAYIGHEDLTKVNIIRRVQDITIHENYDETVVQNDVAVVMVDSSIPFGRTVKRVVISKLWHDKEYDGLLAGWGIVDHNDAEAFTVHLLSVHQIVRQPHTCAAAGHLSPGMFCSGSLMSSDPHLAAGDSGSAFMLNNFHQVGILSFTITSYPALIIYSNVTYYYKWIKLHSKLLYCKNSKR